MKTWIAAALAALLLPALSMPALAQAPAVVARQSGALVTENVPETPAAVRESLRRYQNTRSAALLDWLADGSMLISTRFGQTSQVHRVAAPGGDRRQITFYDEPVGSARGRPGHPGAFMFARDTGGDEYFQLYLADLTGTAVPSTEPRTQNSSAVWSKDGSMIAWTRVTPGSGDWDIMVMRADAPDSRRLALKGVGANAPLDISPDGTRLLVVRRISAAESRLFVLDLASGALREITPSKTPTAYGGGRFTADGQGVLVLSDEGVEAARLVRIDLATGAKAVVADAGPWEIEDFDVTADGRILAYAVNEDGRSRVVLKDLAGGGVLPQPVLPVGVLTGLEFSPDDSRLAIGLNTAASPADVWTWDLTSSALARWTQSEMGGLDPARMAEPTLARFKSFDGLQIPAWVYRPRNAKGPAPVIIDIHGGPEGQSRPGFVSSYQYWVNELGAAVVIPNVRGSTGYGKTYLGLDNGLKRQDSVRDIGALLDWIATQPDLDKTRVVVSGGSYGGFMSLASLAAYNDRLAGAMDSVGISSFTTFLTNTEGYRRDLRRVEYGDERDPKMRAEFDRISPLNLTARMSRPLFVVAGFNDPRVPWTEGRQIADKVRANGGEVWWMMAKDEGHGFRKKPNRDAQREAETLFLKKVFGIN